METKQVRTADDLRLRKGEWQVGRQGQQAAKGEKRGFTRDGGAGGAVVARSCPTLCNLVDYGPPGPSVHGILQARILEWVSMPSSRGSS